MLGNRFFVQLSCNRDDRTHKQLIMLVCVEVSDECAIDFDRIYVEKL